MSDYWQRFSDGQRKSIQTGEAAMRVLRKHESVERWREVGAALNDMQQVALRDAGANVATGRRYAKAWGQIAQHVPHLRELDKAARSLAMWLATHWESVNAWLHTLPPRQRFDLVHPRSIRRHYDVAHRPPLAERPLGTAARVSARRIQVTICQQESPADVTVKLAELFNVATRHRLITALVKQTDADERQDKIEAKAKRKPPFLIAETSQCVLSCPPQACSARVPIGKTS